jgi:hypothetical protein
MSPGAKFTLARLFATAEDVAIYDELDEYVLPHPPPRDI